MSWSSEHCMTLFRLQNFFTNTTSLKCGMYINFISFQEFRKHEIWEREHRNRGNGTCWEQKCPQCRATAFIDTTSFKTQFLLSQIPLNVPRWLHVNSHIFTMKSVSSEAARALVLGKCHFVLLTHHPTVHHFQHLHVASVLPLSLFFMTNQKTRGLKTGLFLPYDLKKKHKKHKTFQ